MACQKGEEIFVVVLGMQVGSKGWAGIWTRRDQEVDKTEVIRTLVCPEPHAWAWTRAPALFPTQVVYTRQCALEHRIKVIS